MNWTHGLGWYFQSGYVYCTVPGKDPRTVRIAVFSVESCRQAIKAMQDHVTNRRKREAYADKH